MSISPSSLPEPLLAPRHDVPAGGRTGFTRVDGRQIHFLCWGPVAGPAVVCLHGGGQTAYMFEELGPVLAASGHFVLAPDLPGHGDSDPLDDFGRRELAATIAPLCAHFGVEHAAFVGASLGGMTSITVAAARPDLVAAIVLIDVGHRLEEEGVRRIIDFMQAYESFASLDEAATEISKYLPHRRQVRPESLARNLRQRPDGRWQWKHVLAGRLQSNEIDVGSDNWRTILEGLDEEAASLRCPVLVLRGSASDVLSSEGADEVAGLIPNARVAVVAKAGHLAAGDNPESTTDLISSFFAEVGW
ncbi:MAG TPA: alpha/beta hydrolase [Acidimicrobiales bacterium]|nr:alpha/beta hydrolase [Acidimicrobiales bacterium]